MTRILIVDDDARQLRMLARAVSMRRRDLTVLTASHGGEAIEVLDSGPIDFVLTDLQMPEVNGFELLAWMSRSQPHVPVCSMTAYPDSEAVGRLSESGSIECFTKPVDIPVLLERISGVLAEGTQGHVRNIGLPSFLQLLEMERKTCTLTIESEGRAGYLYLRQGRLIHGRCTNTSGERAAMAILSWDDPVITILGTCEAKDETIETPLGFLIMDALRQRDEESRDSMPEEPASGEAVGPPPARERSAPVATVTPAMGLRRPSVSSFPAYLPSDARAVAIVEPATGRVRNAVGSLERLDAHAALVAELFRVQCRAIEALELDDAVREAVFTMAEKWTVVRPFPETDSLVMLVFDPEQANLVMERMALDGFVAALGEWCAALVK